ncbi:PAB-dependent poly(A)-specific ribonuclease subunit 2 [Trichinella pseudospiralis]|uniref:PAB-dependent poly(A)-specific ribonuclease subunit 2 n=1 Tax=Trichinella pseudospiralis TaxID=6337 RepID=A0A0V0YPT4_TRIPS|nr:PAB-dependent poly(A)-specific ribonuclease subunit 2 [Trichinella pseudospiralis]
MFPAGHFVLLNSIMDSAASTGGVTAVAFDSVEELLWTGNAEGHVTSYHGSALTRYTSFQMLDDEVRAFWFSDAGVLALGRNALKLCSRQGIPILSYNFLYEDMQFECLALNPLLHNVLVLGGFQPTVIMFGLEVAEIVLSVVLAESDCVVMKSTEKMLITGHSNGNICLRNPLNFSLLQELNAHSGSLSDFVIRGSHLVTCGFSQRDEDYSCDPFLVLYDLRTVSAIAPVNVLVQPSFLRFIPSDMNSVLVVVSQFGDFQIVNIGSVSDDYIYKIETQGTHCTAVDVSPSGQVIALADESGCLHVFVDRAEPAFVENARPLLMPDPIEISIPIGFDDVDTPLSAVPLPMTGVSSLSDWPAEYSKRTFRRQLPIPQEVLKAMKTTEFVGYAPNVLGMRRNQVSYHLKPSSAEHGGTDLTNENSFSRDDSVQKIPEHYRKFRKEYKSYHHILTVANARSPDLGNLMMGLEAPLRNSYVNSMLLALYWVVPLRNTLLSHLCSRQFCLSCELSFLFSMLNRNPVGFSCNSNNFIRSFRTLPEAFALGLVLNDKIDMPKENDDYKSLIQNFCRFILRHINSELKDERLLVKPKPKIQSDHLANQVKVTTPNAESSASIEAIATTAQKAEIDLTRQHFIAKDECQHESTALPKSSSSSTDTASGIDFLFTMSWENITRCRCGMESAHHPGSSFVCTLSYPSHALEGTETVTFETILENSLCLEQNTHAWCQKCLKFEVAKHYKRIQSLPDVLCINCNIDSDKVKQFWIAQQTYMNPEAIEVGVAEKEFAEFLCSSNRETDPANVDFVLDEESMDVENTWLPLHMAVKRLQDGRVVVARKRIANSSPPEPEAKDYILSSVISCIETNNSGHLVTCINLPCNNDRQWFLINETHVKKISHKDAIKFDVNWKTPCVLFYSRLDLEQRHHVEVQNPIDERVFFQENMATPVTSGSSMSCSSQVNQVELRYLPKRGDLVAMDAEFVTLNLEEAEVRSDGRKLTLKPSLLLAARVTCIYGSGPLKGSPIFDNYIITREHISDYQTKFSGIKPGDLDPTTSNKNTLVAMKTVYLKLRYFVDNGIKFVGHGLQNDFKVINIYVPPEQTVDTVELFRLPRRRLISLRFLAWFFLNIRIQSNTHDSAEDAHSALVLYERYKEMTENKQNNFHNILNNLYLRGQQLHWTIPNS